MKKNLYTHPDKIRKNTRKRWSQLVWKVDGLEGMRAQNAAFAVPLKDGTLTSWDTAWRTKAYLR